MLVDTKARIGVFSIALEAYLPQFPSLAAAAGDKFRAADVDLVILQLLTYAASYNMLPAVRDLAVDFKVTLPEKFLYEK